MGFHKLAAVVIFRLLTSKPLTVSSGLSKLGFETCDSWIHLRLLQFRTTANLDCCNFGLLQFQTAANLDYCKFGLRMT